MIHLLRVAWDRASMYLPVLLMGVLALGTYWLVHTAPVVRATGTEAALRHEPDYFMRGFSMAAYDAQGRRKSDVGGAEMRHYPDNDALEIDRPQIRAFKLNGMRASASAELARASGDGRVVELFGNAVMVREDPPARSYAGTAPPRMEFRSDYLHAEMDTGRVRSHRPVSLSRGGERLSGDAFEYSDQERVLELRGRVVLDLAGMPRK